MSMSVAVNADPEVMPPPGLKLQLLGLGIAVALHAGMGTLLLGIDPSRLFHGENLIEMEIAEKTPPPPELRPDPPPPPPEPEPPPRLVPKRLARKEPVPVTTAQLTPPPPNQEPPPNPSEAPPVFGVTMSSVVSGDSAMAVQVGNTLMTKDRKPPKASEPARPYAAEGTRPFTPVAEIYVAEMPRVLREANSADIYPPEARKMGIEGSVVFRVGLDENGNVKEVKVSKVTPPGYEFDSRAREALMKLTKFSPARTSDGKAVPFRITYTYRFTLPQ